jgi:S-adenosyl-L-methionine hydrolase (adenosine-forming)
MKRRGEGEKGRRRETKSLKSRFPIPPSPNFPVAPSLLLPISQSPHLPVTEPPHLPVAPSPLRPVSLITLLTDFGTSDYFVSAMKGAILSINPDARVVDITHEIPAQDIEAAAFTLLAAHSSFPSGTIHVAVVDPGVGSARRAILVETDGQFFVGPDNGIFSYVCECEPQARVFEVTNKEYFHARVSSTFHGRDVFAPVAAALSNGIAPSEFGKQITNPVLLAPLLPEKSKNGTVRARIIHIDRFGNCITNLTSRELTEEMISDGAYLVANGAKVKSFRNFFSEQGGRGKEVFGIWGSAGFLELAAKDKSAAKILKAKRGQPVVLRMPKESRGAAGRRAVKQAKA